MGLLALSAIGVDRPGIVAAVTSVLADRGCNLEDSTMTILRGHFAILLVVQAPDGESAADLEAALGAVADGFDLVVTVRDLAGLRPTGARAVEGETWTISVHGADRPGIVHAVTDALARSGGNIVDLQTHLVGDPGEPVYVMVVRASFAPGTADPSVAADAVRRAAVAFGVHCSVHRHEPDVL